MDLPGDVDSEFGTKVLCYLILAFSMWLNWLLFVDRQMELLRNNLQRWTELLNEIRAPIANSSLYLDTLQVLERYNSRRFLHMFVCSWWFVMWCLGKRKKFSPMQIMYRLLTMTLFWRCPVYWESLSRQSSQPAKCVEQITEQTPIHLDALTTDLSHLL